MAQLKDTIIHGGLEVASDSVLGTSGNLAFKDEADGGDYYGYIDVVTPDSNDTLNTRAMRISSRSKNIPEGSESVTVNTLELGVNDEGTETVYVSSPDAWRAGIGAFPSAGGTIDGDVTIEGAATVGGAATFSNDMAANGNITANNGIRIRYNKSISTETASGSGSYSNAITFKGNNPLAVDYGLTVNSGKGIGYSGGASINFTASEARITSSAAGITNRAYGVNKVLWSGGYYMTAGHTCTLSQAVTAQPNGIILCWSAYANGTSQDYNWSYTFVPKYHISHQTSKSVQGVGTFNNFGSDGNMSKYVYVEDTKITGNNQNTKNATTYGGITVTNSSFVLRYVLGV